MDTLTRVSVRRLVTTSNADNILEALRLLGGHDAVQHCESGLRPPWKEKLTIVDWMDRAGQRQGADKECLVSQSWIHSCPLDFSIRDWISLH